MRGNGKKNSSVVHKVKAELDELVKVKQHEKGKIKNKVDDCATIQEEVRRHVDPEELLHSSVEKGLEVRAQDITGTDLKVHYRTKKWVRPPKTGILAF